MEIYLIRHSRVSVSPNVCYGISDVELHENSEIDIENIFDQLPIVANSKFYSSPLTRCKKLAESLTQSEIIFDDRLKELNFGDWELKIWEDIPENEFNLWKTDYVQNSPTNGESYQEIGRAHV